ncbi:spore coat assembly protein [Aneurinibacillus soli]|uniref:Sporulation-specific protease YabG n=1 Tax=Aneurinibacillus soli TaxID=1500254 RepID=A0A0U4WBK2_9BACL|nr:sporulation peptidase YabG [Aneurinibacillus soli]PYE58318.1 spore coat assembly protein [Aneurinibacillus soli]BAU26203.1 Sporulation-specific protease YabG [Aneurinibacillus soli]
MPDKLQIGDRVVRKSYGGDVLFQIIDIQQDGKICSLIGVDFRLLADAPLADLVKVDQEQEEKLREVCRRKHEEAMRMIQQTRPGAREQNVWRQINHTGEMGGSFDWPGRVLHLDGDRNYLRKCLAVYAEMKVPADGYYLPEKEFPVHVMSLLEKHRPDILVLTGHDAYQPRRGSADDLNNYRHSRFFVEAVGKARIFQQCKDSLVIFAGACQSHFEAILNAGANFASSPKRINIHTLDPVYIAEQVSYTSIQKPVSVYDMVKHTITGIEGVGGIETRGCFRLGIPKNLRLPAGEV